MGTLYLSYDSISGTDEDALEIGNIIFQTIKKYDLNVEWDGSVNTSICIKGIDWNKRR